MLPKASSTPCNKLQCKKKKIHLHCILSTRTASFEDYGKKTILHTEKSRTGHNTPGTPGTTPPVAEQRGNITSLNLMVILCLMQPCMPLAFFRTRERCWLMLILGHHQDTQDIFHTATFHLGIPRHVIVPGIVPPQIQDCTLSLVELLEIPFSSFLQLTEISLDGSTTLLCQPLLPVLYHY